MKSMLPFLFLLHSFLLVAQTQYIIKKGEHRSQGGFALVSRKAFSFEVRFDSTAIYQTQTQENQGDTNKLYGFSDCLSSHHRNSARFGWRWYNNTLELMAYTYAHKKRHYKVLKAINLNQSYRCQIKVKKNIYVFSVEDVQVEMPRGCHRRILGYKLFPYFGGNEVAPHDVHIWIKE